MQHILLRMRELFQYFLRMRKLSSKSNVPSFSAAATELHLICGHNITPRPPPPASHNTCGQGAIIIMRRVVNGNPVSYNAEGAQAFSVICSYVLKVAQLAFCLTGKNSFFCVADPDPERI
jgi:hypothetical protein